MKNTGVPGPVSSYDFANSMVLFSTYLLPSFSSIKFLEMEKETDENIAFSNICSNVLSNEVSECERETSLEIPTTYRTAYVILSGRNALIMHSFCSAVLFFHS